MRTLLLRLLLAADGLETPEEWAAALDGAVELGEATDAAVPGEEGGEDGPAPLIAAIDEVVPYLPDYSAVSAKLKAVMDYCAGVYSSQVDRLVQGWLQRGGGHSGGMSTSFRRWVLYDWLKCSHLTSAEPAALLQWKHALLVAATSETSKPLRRTVLKYLSAVDEAIEARFKDEDGEAALAAEALKTIETVEKLLDFCWLHAEQLAGCSLLCAAKLHALAVRTQRSAMKLSEDDEVMVRLRWSLLLKPMLFKPLLQHAVALKSIPGSITASQLWTSEELTGLVALMDPPSRELRLADMTASTIELERAFVSGAEHVHGAPSEVKSQLVVEAAVADYVQALSAEKRKQLLSELERDLDEAPPHLFPHILMFFRLMLDAALSSPTPEDQELLTDAASVLCVLFDRRSHDANSCLDALGLLLRVSLAAQPIWLANPSLYLQTTASLSEAATLQVEPRVKWAARMALQQLLLECDDQLLRQTQAMLPQLLPQRTLRLVTLRLGR